MRVAVVVPAYNAARHLPVVLARILQHRPLGLERVIIVDDGSTDDTRAVARALASEATATSAGDRPVVTVVERPANGGYGAAMKDGLAAAKRAGAQAVATVHADGQYGPEVLASLLDALARRGLDLLQGSRIAGGGARSGGMPRYKIVGNWLLNKLERRVLGLPLTDFHSGYLIYGPRALATLSFGALGDSFDFDLEAIAAARARGLSVGEEPIPTHYGDEISYLNPVTYGLRVLRVLWRFRRGAYAA